MALSGIQLDALQQSILAAYTRDELRRVVRLGLDLDFDTLVPDKAYREQVFALLAWVERHGRLAELIIATYNQNPGNPSLQTLIAAATTWPVFAQAGFTLHQGRASLFAPRQSELVYLTHLLHEYKIWAEKYTPLAGLATVNAAPEATTLGLPDRFLPTEFEKLEVADWMGAQPVKRVAVPDLRNAVTQYRRLVVLGEPGSGKTTTLWRLVYDYASAAQANPTAQLPVFVPLGGYSGAEAALDYAMRYAGDLGPHLPAYLRYGRALLLLDGLNEMPRAGYDRIQAFLDSFPEAAVVVTCRAMDYVEALRLEQVEVKPLDAPRQREYLHHYLGAADGDNLFRQLEGYASSSKRFGGPDPLLALAVNPYFLLMVAQVYRAGRGALPQNRYKLLASFVDTLLERERKRHPQDSWPGNRELRTAYAELAYAMQGEGRRGTAVDADWAVTKLAAAGYVADEVVYLGASATILETTSGQVRFVHQLLQEYFAAVVWQQRLAGGDDLRHYWLDGAAKPSGWEETAVLLAGALTDTTGFLEALLAINPQVAVHCLRKSGGVLPAGETLQRVLEAGIAIAEQTVAAQHRSVYGASQPRMDALEQALELYAEALQYFPTREDWKKASQVLQAELDSENRMYDDWANNGHLWE